MMKECCATAAQWCAWPSLLSSFLTAFSWEVSDCFAFTADLRRVRSEGMDTLRSKHRIVAVAQHGC